MRSMLLGVCGLGLMACASPSDSVGSVGGFRLHIEDAAPLAGSDVADASFVPVVDSGAAPQNSTTPAAAEPEAPMVQYLSVFAGERFLRANEAEALDLDRPLLLGFEFDARNAQGGLGFETGFSWAADDKHGVGWAVSETYGGVRYTLNTDGWLQPYASAGLSFMYAAVDTGVGFVSEFPWGVYLRLGLSAVFGRVRLGVDYRRVFASDMDILGESVNSDFDQFAFSAGWRF
jgi:opacity protein-like surface antigen